MAKNITISTEDSVGLNDRSNMNNTTPKRNKVTLIHEQLYEQYHIDVEKIYEKSGMQKTIPVEWISGIIEENLNSIKIPRLRQVTNKEEKVISLIFENPEICDQFDKAFTKNMMAAINNFIIKQEKKPKDYNRILVVETTKDAQQIIIRY